jgi:hypothetical protein
MKFEKVHASRGEIGLSRDEIVVDASPNSVPRNSTEIRGFVGLEENRPPIFTPNFD